jgi:hypothetical protein
MVAKMLNAVFPAILANPELQTGICDVRPNA